MTSLVFEMQIRKKTTFYGETPYFATKTLPIISVWQSDWADLAQITTKQIVTKLSRFYPSLRRQFVIINNLACPPSLISCRLFPGATINITDEYSAANEDDKNIQTLINYSLYMSQLTSIWPQSPEGIFLI